MFRFGRGFCEDFGVKYSLFGGASNRRRRAWVMRLMVEMIGLDTKDGQVREMIAYYRLMFASEPNVNGRNRGVLAALEKFTE